MQFVYLGESHIDPFCAYELLDKEHGVFFYFAENEEQNGFLRQLTKFLLAKLDDVNVNNCIKTLYLSILNDHPTLQEKCIKIVRENPKLSLQIRSQFEDPKDALLVLEFIAHQTLFYLKNYK